MEGKGNYGNNQIPYDWTLGSISTAFYNRNGGAAENLIGKMEQRPLEIQICYGNVLMMRIAMVMEGGIPIILILIIPKHIAIQFGSKKLEI